jgi:hypothetical protein
VPARLTSEGLLSEYRIPNYRYFPARLLPNSTRDWARVRFLQACERLNVPHDLWPDFREILDLPPQGRTTERGCPVFCPPNFDLLTDAATEWRRRAEMEFGKHCDTFLRGLDDEIQRLLRRGILTRIRRPKGKATLDQRYEWAVRRCCLGHRFKDIATAEFSEVMIRKAVNRIFSEVKLKGVTKGPPAFCEWQYDLVTKKVVT